MKKYIITLLVMASGLANAQNLLDPPPIDSVVSSSIINRNNIGFIRGWNWGSPGVQFDQALGINLYHGWSPPDNPEYLVGMNHAEILRRGIIDHGRNHNEIFVALGLHLEPTISVDTTENFVPSERNRHGAVYGFQTKNTIVGSLSSDIDRYVLTTENFDTAVTVLKDIWDGTQLRWLDYIGVAYYYDTTFIPPDTEIIDTIPYKTSISSDIGVTNSGSENSTGDRDTFHIFNGKQYCLSINLRALDSDSVEAHLTDTILVLRMPYVLVNTDTKDTSTADVRFDRVPQQSFSANDSIIGTLNNHYRGITRLDQADANQPNKFVITGEMFKNLSDTNKSITLSAYAEFTGDTLADGSYETNPIFRYDWHENRYDVTEYITEIDVEVEYWGNLDVAIDWLRIETPRLRDLMRGEYDSLVRYAITDLLEDNRVHEKEPKIYRFYANDEPIMSQWSALRYFNMLVDTLAATEMYLHENLAAQFSHATVFREKWSGSNFSRLKNNKLAAPYFKASDANPFGNAIDNTFMTLGLTSGYAGNVFSPSGNQDLEDIFDSEYETVVYTSIPGIGIRKMELPITMDIDDFFYKTAWDDYNQFQWVVGTQHLMEMNLYKFFYKKSGLIFGDAPWWANVWTTIEGANTITSREKLAFLSQRPLTGEELRYQLGSLVSLGAKGFVYWFKTTDTQFLASKNYIVMGLQCQQDSMPVNILTGFDFLYSDSVGGDFINLDRDPNALHTTFDVDSLSLDAMDVSEDRLYIGQKSTRAEIGKFHKWIDEYEDLLLNLKLIAWKAKGLYSWIAEDPYSLDEFNLPEVSLSEYLYPLATRTRPLGRLDEDGKAYYEQQINSTIDSGFYDVTLHFELDSTGSRADEDIWYLMVQNRRTDPLIKRQGDTTRLDFYSTAEFDKYVVTGGTGLDDTLRNASWWQEKWWARQGCREISIKMHRLLSVNKNKLIKVTELGLSHDTLKAIHIFDGDTLTDEQLKTLYPRYERIIGLESNITANYLPGEMKLFKCEFIDDDNDLTGDLKNSNQTKLVAHPVLDSTGAETEAIQYHLVYFKTDTSDNDRVKVYYSRSEPLDSVSTLGELDPINFPNDDRYPQNIIWQRFDDDEKCFIISDNFIDHLNQTANLDECDYPAIVVRKDTNDNKLKAYIIYTCRGDATNDNARVNVSALDVTNPVSDPVKLSNTQIDVIYTPADSATQTYPRRSHWGTPVVNASANGIYYAWSSGGTTNPATNSVIKAAYAPPDSGIPSTTLTIQDPTFNFNWSTVGKYQKFPSLNPYSDINSGEEHCSMVWVCDFDNTQFGNKSKILYTNLKLDTNGNINCLLPSTLNVDNRTFYTNTNGDLAIIGIAGNNRYPVINRLTLDLSVIFSNLHIRYERIFSEIDNGPGTRTSIFSLGLIMCDLGNTLSTLDNSGQFNFINIRDNLYQPNVCQPTGFYNDDYIETRGVSDYVLNFRADNTSLYQSLGKNKTGKLDFSDFEVTHRYVALGDQVHLSQYPGSNYQNVWRNRRVFNDSTSIIANPRFFFLLEPEDLISETFLGFSSDSGSVYISKVLIDSTGLDFYLPYDSISYQNQTGYFYNGSDTLWSNWFSVGTNSYLKFQTYGLDSTAKLLLQYSDDSSFVDLELPTTLMEDSCYYINYNLKEGESYNFRMVLIGNDTNKVYKEHLLIDGIPIMDTLDYTVYLSKPIVNEVPQTKGADNNIILEITPIPAQDVVYVTARLPQQFGLSSNQDISLKLMSLDGSELNSFVVQPNITKEIPLDQYSQGMYFIRAETSDGNLQKLITPVTKQFIIER